MSILHHHEILLILLASLFTSSNAQMFRHRTTPVGRIIGGCIVAGLFIIFLLCLCMLMVRRRRRVNTVGAPMYTPTFWTGRSLWGGSNANNDPAYGGQNVPQGSYGYQPYYGNNYDNNYEGGNQQGPYNNAPAPPPTYQAGSYGPNAPSGQNYNAPPVPPPAAYTKAQ